MLHANGEPPILNALGLYSPTCDEMGVDFLLLGKLGLIGVQRKACADLVASLHDPRIFNFLTRGDELAGKVLLVEGDFDWDRAGNSRTCPGFTRWSYLGVTLSMQRKHGVMVVETSSLEETAAMLPRMESWFNNEDKVSSLLTIPKASVWANKNDKQKVRVLRQYLQVDGVSMGKAIALYDTVGFPVALTMTGKEIQKAVKGIGPKIAQALEETFSGKSNGTDPAV